jgi:hypothetical protein|tara:strand:- start:141 stop:491 length:351 start_codon:yes stop_codon:yes gene_type:complete
MTSRYDNTEDQLLSDIDYRRVYTDKFDKGRKKFIPKIASINIDYPTFDEILDLEFVDHIWTMGDHYYKLADLYYGNPNLWWIIAWFNKKPTESHVDIGDIIRVPKSAGSILAAMGF